MLDFQIPEILTVGQVQMLQEHRHAKFGQNHSNGCGDIEMFRFFKDGGRPPSWICSAHFGTIH